MFGLALLALAVVLSLMVGSRTVPPADVLQGLRAYDRHNDLHLIVREMRIPRTLVAILAGLALGLAGAIMQAVTRNPLAEPGLLGINAGAAVEDIGAGIAVDPLIEGIAGQVDGGGAGDASGGEELYRLPGREREAGRGDDGVAAFACSFEDLVGGAVDVERVVSAVAIERIAAGASVEHVRAGVAVDPLGKLVAGQV